MVFYILKQNTGKYLNYIKRSLRFVILLMLATSLIGCTTLPSFFPTSGPSTSRVLKEDKKRPRIPVINLDDSVARRLQAEEKHNSFAEELPKQSLPVYVVNPGDVLQVTIWEAPPPTLFGTTVLDPRVGAAVTQATAFPDQMVEEDGTINVPFAGEIPVTGKSLEQIEKEIENKLAGKANQPQVLVRVTQNASSNVTIVGEVGRSLRMPLTAKRERLLDALAAAGGVKQSVEKITIQLSRNGKVLSMPLDKIIRDPKQNIVLQPNDVITALYQPLSFTALGATGTNREINFEAQGITLAQALGRIGGLQDLRSNPQGVFIFRFEDPAAVEAGDKPLPMTADGKVPVIYRADLKDPATFLIAQNFPMHDKDVVYVANATAADLQKFLNILTSSLYTIVNIINL